jgi:hypothetical protein
MQRMLSRILGSKTNTNRQVRPKKVSLQVETLEQRALMSVTAATLSPAGVLHVVTDSANNQVEIRETTPVPIINLANPGVRALTRSGPIITVTDLTRTNNNTYTFNRSEVQRIEVDMGAGNDRLVSDASVPTLVRAGAGNDFVETGLANDIIFAGEGNDTVHANDGDDIVHGEGGDDVLVGGNGDDTLNGNAGADALFGEAGNDILNGGDNAAANQLYGQAGDDMISSFSRNDLVGGGTGRDTLFIVAGTKAVQDGENVTIATDSDQPQTDGFSCGPNSGSRLLRSYGFDVSYDTLRHKVKSESLLFKLHLGTRPSVLHKVLKGFKSDLTLHTGAALQDVLDRLGSGKPVIPLIASGKRALHYVVLNGFDLDSGTIRYVGTNGVQGSWTFAEFEHRWKWENFFTGVVGRLERAGLKVLGMRSHTFLA